MWLCTSAGYSDGWQSCGGAGSFNGSHNTIDGDVLVNLTRFPDMKVSDRAVLQAAAPAENCHFTDVPSPSLLKHLIKVEGGAAE